MKSLRDYTIREASSGKLLKNVTATFPDGQTMKGELTEDVFTNEEDGVYKYVQELMQRMKVEVVRDLKACYELDGEAAEDIENWQMFVVKDEAWVFPAVGEPYHETIGKVELP